MQSLAWQLICAVNNIHRAKVCHRDLKPDNVMIDYHPESNEIILTLIDFNVAIDLTLAPTAEIH